ncbi:AI-2E family transporter [Lichenifustis flavocetrariae]|uniref:AI-2E family transporter n=1 Tax=Lichenifustis flavocetrariae TaxID=2949735 RepID=A0AA41Z0Q8_9HYPH|nr:AI-2E family transporter [Lichenifustis flavocetrariae]MCW6510826.1 AI-2E family transporter [Lichenifustis flavocetrariae]
MTSPESATEPVPSDRPAVLPSMVGGAILVAGLYCGRELVVPLVLAALLAFVLAPACRLLERARLPHAVAVVLVVLLTFAFIGGLGMIVGHQAADLAGDLPSYQSTIMGKWHALGQKYGFLAKLTEQAPTASKPAEGGTGQQASLPFGLGEVSGLTLARNVAQPLLGPLESFGIVLVFTIFILLSSDDLRDRLVRLVGRHDLHRTILVMNDAAYRLSRYFLFQLGLNAGFGTLIGLTLWLAGLPNPLLWGILAALMRFVPYLGVFIALAPPLLLAVAVVPGWSLALIVLAVFIMSETIMGQVIEPLIYGHSTGLSPLAVIVATAFWALLWGPIGLLIATPLTVCLVVIGRHVEALAFLDIMLGDRAPLEPSETFYQRALEGKALSLVPMARQQIAASSLTDYFDAVALPGLALAQDDLVSDTLAFERLEAIHAQIEAVLAQLASQKADVRSESQAVPSAEWKQSNAVVCIPGRGQLDDLAAAMAVQALCAAGFGARVEPNLVLGTSSNTDLAATRLCCLSVLEEGSSVSGIRYFVRRMQKRMPEATIVVGLWHSGRDSLLLAALREEGGSEHLVLSIGELIAFARALSAKASKLRPSERQEMVASSS